MLELSKKECSLTHQNLLELGVLDEFYDAYNSIKEIYQEEVDREINEGKNNIWQLNFDRICYQKTKRVLEDLITAHSYIFRSDERIVHVNAYSMEKFEFIDWKCKNFSFKLAYLSFDKFLIAVQQIVVRRMQKWDYPNATVFIVEPINYNLNKRIENLVEERRSERIVNAESTYTITDEVLWVFKRLSQTSCYKKNHPIKAAIYTADLLGKTDRIRMSVHYCLFCKKYFIGEVSLLLYDENYGKVMAERRIMAEGENSFAEGFHTESKLHRLGYNVLADGMTEKQRHELLQYLLKENKISYIEMCSTIEQNISLFEYSDRHWKAVRKWKEDLKFINEWIQTQEGVGDK